MKKKSKSLFYVGGCSGTNSPTFPRNEFGNLTTAFGILTGKRGVFIDNGSGVGKVSSYLMENEVNEVYGLQTHFHLDHRLGMPLNELLFVKDLVKGFYAPKLSRRSFKSLFQADFGKETWPIAPTGISIVEFKPGKELDTPFNVKTLLLNHPGDYPSGGSIAYRITTPDGDIVIATDGEPVGEHAIKMAEFVSGCALLYIDVQYRQGEYDGNLAICDKKAMSRKGWGHGTPEMLFDVMRNCAVTPKKVIVGHHDPARTTQDLYLFEQEIKNHLIGFRAVIEFAREGVAIEI